MHKHIDWDDPGTAGVKTHYAKDPNDYGTPREGAILSARYQGAVVRIRTQAYKENTSIGEVVALIDPASGERLQRHGTLTLGDIVRLPDDRRAFEPKAQDEKIDD